MKKITLSFAALASLLFSGCAGLTNLTPESVPENSSRTYTISMSAHINDGSVIKDTIKPSIVIDGEIIPMREAVDMRHDRIFEYDYVLPKNRKEAKYYFLLDYDVENAVEGVSKHRQMTSKTVYVLRPISRYVVSMQNERGPVGTVVSVLGRGFDKLDKIIIGDEYADTECISRTTINFVVPPLKAGKNYDVNLINASGEIWVGQFRVDAANMNVSPAEIVVKGGEITTMIFNIGFSAPKGGYTIDVKTNIPSSVIMDDVVVPEGKTSTSVTVKGAAAGKGFMYINAVGFNEKVIPISVVNSDAGADPMQDIAAAAKQVDAKAAPTKPSTSAVESVPSAEVKPSASEKMNEL